MIYSLHSRYQDGYEPISRAMACVETLYLQPAVKCFKIATHFCETFIDTRKDFQRTQKDIYC